MPRRTLIAAATALLLTSQILGVASAQGGRPNQGGQNQQKLSDGAAIASGVLGVIAAGINAGAQQNQPFPGHHHGFPGQQLSINPYPHTPYPYPGMNGGHMGQGHMGHGGHMGPFPGGHMQGGHIGNFPGHTFPQQPWGLTNPAQDNMSPWDKIQSGRRREKMLQANGTQGYSGQSQFVQPQYVQPQYVQPQYVQPQVTTTQPQFPMTTTQPVLSQPAVASPATVPMVSTPPTVTSRPVIRRPLAEENRRSVEQAEKTVQTVASKTVTSRPKISTNNKSGSGSSSGQSSAKRTDGRASISFKVE